MDRIFESGAAASPPSAPASPSSGYATAGNPQTAVPATKPGPYWYHQVTEELRAVIYGSGLTPDHTDLAQLAKSIQSGLLSIAQAGGTADALTGAFNPGITALTNGMTLCVRAASANATTTPTFTPASGTITAKTIVKGNGLALAAGDIAGAGHWIALQYDLTLDKWVMLNPATGVAVAQAASIRGAFSNLQASATGTNATVTVSADEIAVESTANAYKTLRGVALSINSAAAGANGLDTGVLAASTWYSMWVIWNSTTTAGLLSLSETAPTLPAGYTHKARVGWIRTDGTANKYPLGFKQYGSNVQYKVAAGSNLTSLPGMASGVSGSTSTPTWVSVATGGMVPPTAAKISVLAAAAPAADAELMVAPNNQYGNLLSTANPPPMVVSSNTGANSGAYRAAMTMSICLESSNIYWASNKANNSIYCFGWEDNL